MIWYERTLEINGYSFDYVTGTKKDTECSVSIRHEYANCLINPKFIDALTMAIHAAPIAHKTEYVNAVANQYGGSFRTIQWDDYDIINTVQFLQQERATFRYKFGVDMPIELSERAQWMYKTLMDAEEKRLQKAMGIKPTKQNTKKRGYVYLVQSTTGAYKIGRTVNPNDRMKTFEVKLPFEVEYLCVIKTPDMHGLESELHKRFATKRVNGEWFDLAPEDVEYIKGLAND